jgi:hypothetical protein
MASILCDPNYEPSTLYESMENLLYFYEHVYLYSPSQGQMDRAGKTWTRVWELIENGFVIPVGREFWFKRPDRESLFRKATDSEGKDTYKWMPLDEKIASLGRYRPQEDPAAREVAPAGYFVFDNEHRKFAERMEQEVPREREEEFRKFVRRVVGLRAIRQLPQELLAGEFADATPQRLARKLIFYTAGDLRAGQVLGAASLFSTQQMGAVYHAVSSSFLTVDSTPFQKFTVVDQSKEYRLTAEELQIAAKLAEQN